MFGHGPLALSPSLPRLRGDRIHTSPVLASHRTALNRHPGPRLSSPPSGEAGVQPRFWRQLQRLSLLSAGCGGMGSQGWVPAFAGVTMRGSGSGDRRRRRRRNGTPRYVMMCHVSSCAPPEMSCLVMVRRASGPIAARPYPACRSSIAFRSASFHSRRRRPCCGGSLFRAYRARPPAPVGAGAVRAPGCACARESPGAGAHLSCPFRWNFPRRRKAKRPADAASSCSHHTTDF